MKELIDIEGSNQYSRQSYSNFKTVKIDFNGAKSIKNPNIYFTENDEVVITASNLQSKGSFLEHSIPAADDFPVKSLTPGASEGLMSWEPLDEVEYDKDGTALPPKPKDDELWVLCSMVEVGQSSKDFKFSMLPLDDGMMLFCLKEGIARFTSSNGLSTVLSRGGHRATDKTKFSSMDSDYLFFTSEKTYPILRECFISGTIKNVVRKRTINGKKELTQEVSFRPNLEFSARLDNGKNYEEMVARKEEEARLRELELEERERNDEIMRAQAEARRAAEEAAEVVKEAKKNSSKKSKTSEGTSKKKSVNSSKADAFRKMYGF